MELEPKQLQSREQSKHIKGWHSCLGKCHMGVLLRPVDEDAAKILQLCFVAGQCLQWQVMPHEHAFFMN